MNEDIESLLKRFESLDLIEDLEMTITPDQLKAIVESAVSSALVVQERQFEVKLEELGKRVTELSVNVPEVEKYEDAVIRGDVLCRETLDIVKSLPEFEGKHETYVSWRKAAHTAYGVYEKYNGSSTHFQALGIIRNKIRGPADMILASFDTPLNFKAIINRLDFTYADKRPIYLIEQEMSTLRQGNLTLLEYYDEVERKLTLLTNKTIMNYDSDLAASLNEKYRMDALRVFISGAKKSLSDILFSAKPKDLPSALALAQEVESNHVRYNFASNYAKSMEEKTQQKFFTKNARVANNNNTQGKNPYYDRRQDSPKEQKQEVEPMDIDSSRFRQPQKINNQWQAQPNINVRPAIKRPNSGATRLTGLKQQRVNHMAHERNDHVDHNYQYEADTEVSNIENEGSEYDQINFLAKTPCSRT